VLHRLDARTLDRTRRRQRPMLVLGAILLLVGGAYMLWAVERLKSTPAAVEPGAFDRPIAGMARLTAAAQDRLSRVRPVTDLERSLLEETRVQIDINGRLLVLVLRLLIGSVLASGGLVLLASALAERPLLGILKRLGA
jgi:hypothetical protein